MLSNQSTVRDFYPIEYLPRGVRLPAYGGEAGELPAGVLQQFLDDVAAGPAQVPVGHVYGFDEIVEAHRAMEAGTAAGKLVVLTPSDEADLAHTTRFWLRLGSGPLQLLQP
jgi:hypothetical protein